MTDVTQLSEARFRAALDGLLEGVNIFDRELRYVYANPAAAAQGKQRVENLIGQRMRDMYPGVEHSEFYKTLERIVAGAPACRITTPFDFPDGSVGYFQLILEPMADGGVFLLSVETTAQVRAEAALRASEARVNALLQGLPNLVILLDRDGVVIDVHVPPAFPVPHAPTEWIGRPLADALPNDVAQSTVDIIKRVKDTREPGTLHYELAVGGMTRRFEGTIVISQDDHFTVVVHDETARVSLEEQLRQSQKMEAVGQLTGGIAHDFNNLLTVISGNAELLAEQARNANAPVPHELEEITGATRRGADMVSQLLRFSRRGVLRRHVVDPASVIAHMTAMLGRLLPASVRLDVGALRQECTLLLDTGALEQIITNLCTNARDAMPQGGTILIDSDIDASTDGNRWYRITVRDSGHGMSEETQAHLFEPFFTTKPFGAGTGLGMSMVYGLMKSHGGRVDVRSTVGAGTEVRLYFPLATVPELSTAIATDEPPAPDTGTSTSGRREGVLLVEDDVSIRRATRRALESKGYHVWEAGDGLEGLHCFRAHESDIALVISDLVMPNVGGRQMAETIRAGGSHVPILFTSGYSSNWIYGEDGLPPDVLFLAKPWTLVDLFTTVRQSIDRDAARRAT